MLDIIPDKNKLSQMKDEELVRLAEEIRGFLLQKVSEKGGHLSSNLGAVELTLALFSVFDFPKDKVIFDVGHQSYTYKLLTGRKDGFDSLRELGGMSGFPKRHESEYDAFDTGHSSTSISAGLGLCRARDLKQEDYHVVSVIGDGSMTGGMAYEALNNAAQLKSNFIIVLNDNEMSISKNVGGLNRYLTAIRSGKRYNRAKEDVKDRLASSDSGQRMIRAISNAKDSVKELFVPSGMFFENIGITYLGPVDGHDVRSMERVFERAKNINRPVLVHIATKKGRGYEPAEKAPGAYHGVDPFDLKTGKPLKEKKGPGYSEVFGKWAVDAANRKPEIVAITAAMGDNVGLHAFEEAHKDRFFDVGIAEEHAVTFAAGMAAGGLKPVAAIFSSFLQRSYDQIVHDVCMQDLPVILAVDRAGLVGHDGETHQGVFDIAYLRSIPGMTVMAPKNAMELTKMLEFAENYNHPASVRYPRGEAAQCLSEFDAPVELGKAEVLIREKDVALLALGDMVETAMEVHEKLASSGLSSTVVNMRFAKPIDEAFVRELLKDHRIIVTMENGVINGGFGEAVAAIISENSESAAELIRVGVPDRFISQGDVPALFKLLHMDAESVKEEIVKRISQEG